MRLMESKGVRISLTREGKINKASNESKLAFYVHGNLLSILLCVSVKLWGVMNSILFDYANQTEENRKLLIEFFNIELISS